MTSHLTASQGTLGTSQCLTHTTFRNFVPQDFGCPKLVRPGFMWDLASVGEKVEQFLEAVYNNHHIEMVQEVCEAFRKQIKPKLHLLPKQIIHGDANYTNFLMTSGSHATEQDFGFIDFSDVNYTCRVFEIAVSLMYIFNLSQDSSCDSGSRKAGHFFAGYHSVNPFCDEEIQLLPVLIASRFCHSLVYGAFYNKYLYPDNEYIMETSKEGWKNFKTFLELPKEDMLKMWLQTDRTPIK